MQPDQETILKELLDYFPKNLESIGIIDGMTIFSSDKIMKVATAWISKHPSTKSIRSKIYECIKDGAILIGYGDRSKLAFIMYRFQSWIRSVRGISNYIIFGWYSSNDHKIGIILDENVSIFGKVFFSMPVILTHELCHMAVAENPRKCISLMLDKYLLPFYKVLVENINPKCRGNDKELSKTIEKLITTYDRKFPAGKKVTISTGIHAWVMFFTSCNLKKEDVIIATSKILSPFASTKKIKLKNIKRIEDLPMIEDYFCKAYDKIGVRNAKQITAVGQEAIFPSEILCILNEHHPSSEMINLINLIDTRR